MCSASETSSCRVDSASTQPAKSAVVRDPCFITPLYTNTCSNTRVRTDPPWHIRRGAASDHLGERLRAESQQQPSHLAALDRAHPAGHTSLARRRVGRSPRPRVAVSDEASARDIRSMISRSWAAASSGNSATYSTPAGTHDMPYSASRASAPPSGQRVRPGPAASSPCAHGPNSWRCPRARPHPRRADGRGQRIHPGPQRPGKDLLQLRQRRQGGLRPADQPLGRSQAQPDRHRDRFVVGEQQRMIGLLVTLVPLVAAGVAAISTPAHLNLTKRTT